MPGNQPKRAIVVGATSGIGREIARQLAAAGWLVGAAGRRTDRLQALKSETPGVAVIRAIDVQNKFAPAELRTLIEELGGMDLYFHASGIGFQNPTLDPAPELETVRTNALGFTRMLDAAFAYFRERPSLKGRIAAISSIAGTRGIGAAPAYSATKAFQANYLEALDQLARMSGLGVRVTDIRPGFVDTALLTDGGSYPMQMRVEPVARAILRAIRRGSPCITIDTRYRIMTFFWRHLPRWIWVRMPIHSKPIAR